MKSLDQLRRDAKALRKTYEAGDAHARQRLEAYLPRAGAAWKHADYLHVVARENSFESWPKLVWAAETVGLDCAAKQQRLKIALFHGQNWVVDRLLEETPDLAAEQFGLQCALFDRAAVEAALAEDAGLAVRNFGPRRPILHLAYSKRLQAHPELEGDMMAIARALVAHRADVNDSYPAGPETDHRLSALYGAIGHANNMVLGRWLLEQGADPNDGESLYHATELGHHEGLKMLLAHGAVPQGTNALLRAMDFDDTDAVRMLLAAGADVDEAPVAVGGQAPEVMRALHHAARRMVSAEMVEVLLAGGARADHMERGMSAYAFARVFGHRHLTERLEARGAVTPLTPEEAMLARIADGEEPGGFVDPERLPEGARYLVREILHLPGKLDHVKRLIAAGMEYDRPDGEGLTPVQVAGWEGLPEVMGYLLSLKPDLGHVNTYGGTLLSTIIHGSENNGARAERDHVGCLRLALEEGVALPKRAIDLAGAPEVAAFLADWAEAHPGQVVDGGVA